MHVSRHSSHPRLVNTVNAVNAVNAIIVVNTVPLGPFGDLSGQVSLNLLLAEVASPRRDAAFCSAVNTWFAHCVA